MHDYGKVSVMISEEGFISSNEELDLGIEAFHELVLEHGMRCARIAFALSLQMGLTIAHAREISQAGCLHDLGKLLVPLGIWKYQDAFTPEMSMAARAHSELAVDLFDEICADYQGNRRILDCVARDHHERWDGLGSAYGHRDSTIALEARIVAVVDAYDEVMSKRAYEQAVQHKGIRQHYEAMAYIWQGRGTQFDPEVVDAFEMLMNVSRPDPTSRPSGPWLDTCQQIFEAAIKVTRRLHSRYSFGGTHHVA